MKIALAALVSVVVLLLSACGEVTPTPTPIPTPTPVPFKTTTFKVNAGSTHTFSFDLPAGARVEYRYSADLDFNFRVTDPQDNTLTRSDRSITGEGSINADRLGRYTFIFDNSFSILTPKTVTFTSRVVPPGGR